MKTGVKIGLIIGGATLLIGGTIFAVVKMTKNEVCGGQSNNVGDGQSNVDWLISYIGKDKVSQLWNLAWWYANKAKDKSNPIGRAIWDMETNKKTLTKEQGKQINLRGVTYEEVEQASKL